MMHALFRCLMMSRWGKVVKDNNIRAD